MPPPGWSMNAVSESVSDVETWIPPITWTNGTIAAPLWLHRAPPPTLKTLKSCGSSLDGSSPSWTTPNSPRMLHASDRSIATSKLTPTAAQVSGRCRAWYPVEILHCDCAAAGDATMRNNETTPHLGVACNLHRVSPFPARIASVQRVCRHCRTAAQQHRCHL